MENQNQSKVEVKENSVDVIYEKLEIMTGSFYSKDQISILSNTVAKGTTATELGFFLSVAKSSGLNPFMKQIWCYKDHKGNLIIMAGRDGFLTIAQKNERWNGMVSSEVYENDLFEVDVTNGVVSHKPNYKDRGALLGAYCLIKPKGVDTATYEWAGIKDYDKSQFIWNTHKNEMIKKVAEIHALKKAFGINGLYCEEEMIPMQKDEKYEEIENQILNCQSVSELDDLFNENKKFITSPKNLDLFILFGKTKKTFEL